VNDESFREIQLNGKQLVFLFMAATVVSVVIFLCGVLVGRGVRPEATALTEMAKGEIAADPGAAPPPEPASSSAGAPSASATADPPKPADELSYSERLLQDAPPEETLKPAPAPLVQEPVPAQPAARPSPPAPAAASTGTPDPPAVTSSDPSGPGFAVQVAAYKDRREADSLAKQLVAKGYPAFVMDPVKGAPSTMYRVRVGKYRNRRDAEAVSTRLEAVEQFKPWIAR
jgi:DedD protein